MTGGTVFVVLGGGIGIGIRGLLEGSMSANQADGILVSISASCFFIAGLLALRIKREELGPLPHEVKKQSVVAAYQEMVDGYKFLRTIKEAACAYRHQDSISLVRAHTSL